MAQRHTVYLKQSAAKITPEQLLDGIREVDLHLLAESCGVSDELIDEALVNLRIEKVKPKGFNFWRLVYRPGERRQVEIDRLPNAGAIAEVLEHLDPDLPCSDAVRAHLGECVESVSASYGSMPGEAMAPILGSEVCRWLAEKFCGTMEDPSDDWYELGECPDFKPLQADLRSHARGDGEGVPDSSPRHPRRKQKMPLPCGRGSQVHVVS